MFHLTLRCWDFETDTLNPYAASLFLGPSTSSGLTRLQAQASNSVNGHLNDLVTPYGGKDLGQHWFR